MSQSHCPNCGGYKVAYTSFHVDATTGESRMSQEAAGCGAIVYWIILVGMILAGIVYLGVSFVPDPSISLQQRVWPILVGLLFTGVGGVMLYSTFSSVKEYWKANVREMRRYTCNICGKEWTV